MRVTQRKVATLANTGRTHQARNFQARYLKSATPSRHPFCARCSPSPHSIVAQSTRFHGDNTFGHLQSDGGGRGGANNYFDRWWNSDGGGWSGACVPIICVLLSCQASEAQASPKRNRLRRQQSNMWNDDPELNRYAIHLTDLAWPILQNLGFSGAVGVVCAIALKAIGRVVAIGLGATFAIVQGLPSVSGFCLGFGLGFRF